MTNANANYNGSDLVVKSGSGIIVVSFNYRVGPLGFLAGAEVRRNGDVNVGLLDQRKLLHWVQKYIHSVKCPDLTQSVETLTNGRFSLGAIRDMW